MSEVTVEVRDRLIQFFGLFVLPFAPLVFGHVGRSHAATAVGENVHVVAACRIAIPDLGDIGTITGRLWCQVPIAQSLGVVGVIL